MPKTYDLLGQKLGRLLILRKIGAIKRKNSDKTDIFWECLCDCGNSKQATTTYLQQNINHSCGCFNRENALRTIKLAHKANTLSGKEASFREAFRAYKSVCAEQRGHEFTLTKEEFKFITSKDCYYCETPPSNGVKRRHTIETTYLYNGLDRVDNDKGYTIDNVVPCCKYCNQMKSDLTQEEFYAKIKKINSKIKERI